MASPPRPPSLREVDEEPAETSTDLEVRKLSPSGLAISGAASATASVVGGQLGVAGTVIGAALTSVVAAVALALYSDSVQRGTAKLKQAAVKGRSRPGAPTKGDVFASRTAAGADGGDQTSADEPATTGALPGRRRVLKTVLLALAIALVGIVAVFGIQRFTGTELSPGTGEIQRTVGDSDAVAPRDDSGSPQDVPEDTEQEQDPGEGGLLEPQQSESPQEPDDAPQDQGDGTGDADSPEIPAEQEPAPGTGDGGGSGSSGGDSGEGDSPQSSGSGSSESGVIGGE